jgi:hypothetical protein
MPSIVGTTLRPKMIVTFPVAVRRVYATAEIAALAP